MHVLGRLEVGGTELALLSLCREMAGDGFDLSVATLGGPAGALSAAYQAAGVRRSTCVIEPWPTFPLRLWRSVRRLQPDIVVSHVSLASGFLLVIAWMAGVKRRVASFHSDGDGRDDTTRRRAYRWVMRRTSAAAATDAVGLTASTLRFGDVQESAQVQSHVIPNGVDLERFRPVDTLEARRAPGLPGDAVVLAYAGRAAPEKIRPLIRREGISAAGVETMPEFMGDASPASGAP